MGQIANDSSSSDREESRWMFYRDRTENQPTPISVLASESSFFRLLPKSNILNGILETESTPDPSSIPCLNLALCSSVHTVYTAVAASNAGLDFFRKCVGAWPKQSKGSIHGRRLSGGTVQAFL